MADPAGSELIGRAGCMACVAVSLWLLACTQPLVAPPASSDAEGGAGAPLAGVGGSTPASVPLAPPSPPERADAGALALPPPDSGMADALPPRSSDAGPPPQTTRVSLIDHNRWVQLGADDDPFADRPQDVACEPDAAAAEVLSEEIAYGVDTGRCHYVTARQVTLQPVTAGQTLVVRLWHFQLNAPNPGEAHAAVDVDGLRILDQRVPIPSPRGLIRVEAPLDRAIAAGAPVYFHLHNHGANSRALVEISAGP